MSNHKIIRLAAEAVELKKAWVMGIAFVGRPSSVPESDLKVPSYNQWQIRPLKRHIAELERDVDEVGSRFILEHWQPKHRKTVVAWLAQRYDEWHRSRQPIYEIGRVHEVEAAIGKLAFRRCMECPPYAQVLMQAYSGAALRHPEYHLAKDLALLTNLFLDAERIADDHLRARHFHNNECSQSLGRSVVLTCYNLLESFVNGLVAAFAIEHPNASPELLTKLQEPKGKRASLKARFEDVPILITGNESAMEPYREVLGPLFSTHKWRRDAFVHCEPGPTNSKYGTQKEALFHETDAKTVTDTVLLTVEAIRAAWKVVNKADGPRWLPEPDKHGRFPNISASLVEVPSPS